MRCVRFLLMVMGLILLALTAALIPARQHPATDWLLIWQPNDAEIALHRLSMDGQRQQRLLSVPGDVAFQPRIKVIQGRLYFESYERLANGAYARSLYRTDLNGHHRQRVTPLSSAVITFSPDQQWVYYWARPNGRDALFRSRLDGRQPTWIADAPNYLDDCQWSPDGQWLACDPNIGPNDIFITRQDGVLQQTLPGDSSTVTWLAGWSDDGQWLYYSFVQANTGYLARLHLASGLAQTLAAGYPVSTALHAWGHQLFLTLGDYADADIYQLDETSGDLQNLTNHLGTDWLIEGSPDGAWLYLTSNRTGLFELYRLHLATAHLQRLTATPTLQEYNGRWTHNGQWLVYTANDLANGGEVLMAMRPDGSQNHRLLTASTQGALLQVVAGWLPAVNRPWHGGALVAIGVVLLGVAFLIPMIPAI